MNIIEGAVIRLGNILNAEIHPIPFVPRFIVQRILKGEVVLGELFRQNILQVRIRRAEFVPLGQVIHRGVCHGVVGNLHVCIRQSGRSGFQVQRTAGKFGGKLRRNQRLVHIAQIVFHMLFVDHQTNLKAVAGTVSSRNGLGS